MTMIDTQFYPTPPELAKKAFRTFTNKSFDRILEPQAGRGDLLHQFMNGYCHSKKGIDCIELDFNNQAILREKGLRVIDSDFLQFNGRQDYSHILMNPPFNRGVDHVLKAWDILIDGEIVAILDASSVENPRGSKECFLVHDLIHEHGTVEFLDQQFMTEDTQRKTQVRIALIHLTKKSGREDYSDILKNLKQEDPEAQQAAETDINTQELAIPTSVIENTVRAFNLAVEKIRAAVKAQSESQFFKRRIWSLLRSEHQPKEGFYNASSFNEQYDELKEQAWRAVLESADFTSRLSSIAQVRLEEQFKEVVTLEFTLQNIYGLLSGLLEGLGDMNSEMCCDVFDMFSRYNSENRAYYMGWKSNDKHRECCFRLKTTRIVLPLGQDSTFSIDYRKRQELADMEKVFAMLESKPVPEGEESLVYMLESRLNEVKSSNRFTTRYFDFRFYRGKGTLHLFPRDKTLVDRLNRVVGRQRQWLPDEGTKTDPRFWAQYEKAEKVTVEIHKLLKANRIWEHDFNYEYSRHVDVHLEACSNQGVDLPEGLSFQDCELLEES